MRLTPASVPELRATFEAALKVAQQRRIPPTGGGLDNDTTEALFLVAVNPNAVTVRSARLAFAKQLNGTNDTEIQQLLNEEAP